MINCSIGYFVVECSPWVKHPCQAHMDWDKSLLALSVSHWAVSHCYLFNVHIKGFIILLFVFFFKCTVIIIIIIIMKTTQKIFGRPVEIFLILVIITK